jgi:hypothetical protein
MKLTYLTFALFTGLSLVSVANAAVVWNFASGVTQNTDLSSPQTFNCTNGVIACSPAVNIIAYGAHPDDGSSTDLFAKFTSSSTNVETGLGTNHGTDNEIDTDHLIELDVSSIAANTTLNFLITSVQSGSADVFAWGIDDVTAPQKLASFTGGASGLTENGSTSEQNFNFTRDHQSHEFIAISASSGNVLIQSATITSTGGGTTTPEPRFYGLLLVSLLAIPAIRRRFVPQQ